MDHKSISLLNSVFDIQFVAYYTKLYGKNQALFEKISITRRSLSPSTRSAPFGPARTGVLSAAEGSIMGSTQKDADLTNHEFTPLDNAFIP